MPQYSEQTKGIIAIITMTFAFATMAVFARYLQSADFSLFEQVYLRLAIALAVSVFIFRKEISTKNFLLLSRKDSVVLIFRSLFMYLGVVLFTDGVLHTKLANASVVAFFPLLPFLAYLFLKEDLGIKKIFYIFLSFLGVTFIGFHNLDFSSFGRGEISAFLSMVLFDFSYIARRWQSDKLNNKEITVAMFVVASIFLFFISFLIGETHKNIFSLNTNALIVLILSGFANVATLLLTNYGLQKVNFSLSTNLLAIETLFALFYGLFLFGEVPSLLELLGGAIILFSAYRISKLSI